MLIYAGVDEAGYGPLLGPLCIGCAAFQIEGEELEDAHAAEPPNLWKRLRRAVCRKPGDPRRRIAVDDSKQLKGPADGRHHPLRHLERGVLSFCSCDAEMPADDQALFERLGVAPPITSWYATRTPLPVGQTADAMRIARAGLKRCLADSGIGAAHLCCEAIDAGPFNEQCRVSGSKAAVNGAAAMRLLEAVRRRWPDSPMHIVFDRHGGRTRYLDVLQRGCPGASIRVVEESEAVSRYELLRGGSTVRLSFMVGGDAAHLPVALASMTAKYARELLMIRLNRFFTSHLPDLKPTAGYVQDGRRYLQEIEAVITRLGLRRAELVRES
jgi:hypothetical protein